MVRSASDLMTATLPTSLNGIRGSTLYVVSAVFIAVDLFQTFFMQGAAPGLTAARIGGIVALGFFIASPVVYKITGKRRIASIILLISTLAVIIFSALRNGGAPSPTMPFLAILPLAATILISRVAGILAIAAIGVTSAFLYFSTSNGLAHAPPHSPEQLRALFSSSVFLTAVAIVLIAIFYEKLVQAALTQLGNAKDQILEQSAVQQSQSARLQLIKQQHDIALASAGVGVWEYNIAGQKLTWSSIIHDILGTQDNDTNGSFIEDRIHPDDAGAVRAAMEKSVAENEPFTVIFRLQTASGDYAYIEARGAVLTDSAGKPQSLSGSFFDVTEEQESGALRQVIWRTLLSQDRDLATKIKQVLTQMKDYYGLEFGLVTRLDDNRCYIEHSVSPNEEMMSGQSFDLEHSYSAHIHSEGGARGFNCYSESWIKDHPLQHRIRIEAYIGAPLFVEGKRYGALNFSSRTARQKRFSKTDYSIIELAAQWLGYEIGLDNHLQSLKQSEERFALAAQGSSVGIWDWQDVTCEEEYWSDNFFRLLGYSPQELEPSLSQFKQLLHPEDHSHTFKAVAAHLAKEAPFNVEYRLRCKDGAFRWFLGTGQAVWDHHGAPKRMIGSIMDIHERKKAETVKSEFISTVSHELRTPMTSIIGALELVRSNKFGELSPKATELLDIAASNGQRLVRLINDILDIEKIEAGKIVFTMKPVKIGTLIEEAIRQNESFVRTHNATMTFFDDTEDGAIICDPDRISQVLTNLISNAAKFTPNDGKISISARKDNEHIYIRVEDNGPGIPADKREAVFEKFVQLDSASNRANEGTGLGLSISDAIIAAHGGNIRVESEIGAGTAFTIALRKSDRPLGTDPQARTDSSKLSSFGVRKRVLYLDNDSDSAAVLRHALADITDLAAVPTIKDARNRLVRQHFDLIIMDHMITDESGEDLMKSISGSLHPTPVIIYSTQEFMGRMPPDFVLASYLKSSISIDEFRNKIVAALYEADATQQARKSAGAIS